MNNYEKNEIKDKKYIIKEIISSIKCLNKVIILKNLICILFVY